MQFFAFLHQQRLYSTNFTKIDSELKTNINNNKLFNIKFLRILIYAKYIAHVNLHKAWEHLLNAYICVTDASKGFNIVR